MLVMIGSFSSSFVVGLKLDVCADVIQRSLDEDSEIVEDRFWRVSLTIASKENRENRLTGKKM